MPAANARTYDNNLYSVVVVVLPFTKILLLQQQQQQQAFRKTEYGVEVYTMNDQQTERVRE